MKKTFKELKEADQLIAELYAKNPNLKNTKFGYAWKRFTDKNYTPLIAELNDKIVDSRVEHALTDSTTKELLYTGDSNYKYDKEGMKSLIDANRKTLKEYDLKEVEITPFIVKDLPELTEEETEVLKGLIIQ